MEKDKIPSFLEGYSNVSSLKLNGSEIESTLELNNRETIISNSDSIFYKRFNNLEVDSLERIYVKNEETIHIYDKGGNYIKTLGREGSGPGEFKVIHNFKIKNFHLYVYDANLARISVYELSSFDLKNVISVPTVSGKIGLGEFSIRNDGTIIVGMTESKRKRNSPITDKYMHYYIIDKEGLINKKELLSTSLSSYFEVENERGTSYPPIPFDRTTLFSMSKSDKLYFAWTGKIAIKKFDRVGKYLKGYYYPYDNIEVVGDIDYPKVYSVLDIISDTKRVLGNRLPESKPAVKHFFVDDKERIWLSTITSDNDTYEWWVINENGAFLAKFILPKNEIIKVVRDGIAYTIKQDAESGFYFINRYEIKLN
jgi:hypothetical protein